jgi:hypothetical protein
MFARLVLAVLVVSAAGCKSTPKPAHDRLASVLTECRGPDEIHLVTLAVFREAGWDPLTPAGDQMVFERKGGAWNTAVYGDWIGGPVWLRAKVDLRPLDVRRFTLGCDVYRVIDRGDKFFEQEKKVKYGGEEVQKLLEEIIARLANSPPPT